MMGEGQLQRPRSLARMAFLAKLENEKKKKNTADKYSVLLHGPASSFKLTCCPL